MSVTCTVDENGITAPAYDEVLTYLRDKYREIYGADVYLEADSQDGQFLAILAAALHDANQVAVSVYNAFSPATAVGEGLSRVVKINGLARQLATRSSADLRIVGQVGTVITNGMARDTANQRWVLPSSVTIPLAGEITVTALAEEAGAIRAASNTITQIATPTRGWQTVTNLAAAVVGTAVESDAALRRRQALSTALPSRSMLEGLRGTLASLEGVARLALYENDTPFTDGNGLPPHSIAAVVDGGNASDIAQAIVVKKTSGAGTHGTTSVTVVDAYGVPSVIRFFRPAAVPVFVWVTVQALPGYLSTIGAQLRQAIADYVNALAIGEDVHYSRLFLPANLYGSAESATYNITEIRLDDVNVKPALPADITVPYNGAPTCPLANVMLTVNS